MKKTAILLSIASISLAASFTCFAENAEHMITTGTSQAEQQQMTPEEALSQLQLGNQRFVDGKMQQYNYSKIRNNTASGQYPYAVVLSCLDSRSAPDITLDQGLGNIFVGRVAGNVVDDNLLGSMEFATKHAGAKLIVVMGHTSCGAVSAACMNPKLNEHNLNDLLDEIQPAVKQVSKTQKLDCADTKQVNAIAKQNVINQVNEIYKESPTIKQLVNQHKVMIVGAMHNLATGKVDFFYTMKPEKQTD